MGRRLIDVTGQRFGKLVVIEQVDSDRWGNSRWLCLCDCGKKKETYRTVLIKKTHTVKSCGCSHTTHRPTGPRSRQ